MVFCLYGCLKFFIKGNLILERRLEDLNGYLRKDEVFKYWVFNKCFLHFIQCFLSLHEEITFYVLSS